MLSIYKLKILTALFFFSLLVLYNYTTNNANPYQRHGFPFPLEEFEEIQIPVILQWMNTDTNSVVVPSNINTILQCDEFVCELDTSRKYNKLPESGGAYIFYASDLDLENLNLPLPRQTENVIWSLRHEESPRNVPEASHAEFLKLFNYSSTFSRYSDVPFPLQYMESLNDITSKKYFVETAIKNSLLHNIAPIMYLQSDCDTTTERDRYVEKLMEYISIDSYGKCLNNKKIPDQFKEDYLQNLNEENFLRFVAKYKFVIAIENGICDDYITEKFWRPINVGVVPIYFGSPTIRDWLPNEKSAILLVDYPTPKILSEHITKLLQDDNLYEEYLEHKTKGIIANNRLYEEIQERPYQTSISDTLVTHQCFICKKLYEMKSKAEVNNIVSQTHYTCPKPISALSLSVNPKSFWTGIYEYSQQNARRVYDKVMANYSVK